ncbi:MAG: class I SAM-dependent methyltransferase [Saprospiraceae bacterium]|nr:class I SAM-dependent methyltransferase [Saprospiraceae bacterium]
MEWHQIHGWFEWRTGQQEAVSHFSEGSCFVEIGNFLGRSLCSLAELVKQSGKQINILGIDTCRGSGPEGPKVKDYHREAVEEGEGTFAGLLHKNIIKCGFANDITLIVSDSVNASLLFANQSLDWVHLDGRHDYEGLIADIKAYIPKIKPGGWLSGDDYHEEKWPEVIRAVSDALPRAHPWSKDQWRLIVQ